MQVLQAQPNARTLRQNALDDSLNQIVGGLSQMDQQAKTKRQEALAINNQVAQMREAGYDVTPDMIKQSTQEAPNGIQKFFGAKDPEKVDLYGKRTDAYNTQIANAANDRKFKRKIDEADYANKLAQNKKLQAEAYKLRNEPKLALTPGQKKVDQDFAKDYNDWTSGGAKNTQSEINKLKSVSANIKKGKVTTGGFTGMFGDRLTSNDVLQTRSDIQSTVMNSLKSILGTAFTEKEGERVIRNTWNEADSTENNLERIDRLVADLENQARDKQEKASYYEQAGSSLQDFKHSGGLSRDTMAGNSKTGDWGNNASAEQIAVIKSPERTAQRQSRIQALKNKGAVKPQGSF
jgi:hypothetical protein